MTDALLTWREIRQLALRHRKALVGANLIAVLAAACSVPIPLLLPLLVDEVLLEQPGAGLALMDRLLPGDWQGPVGYILCMLGISLLLRSAALWLNVLQSRLFARLSKDVVYRLRVRLLARLRRIAQVEYETLGSGTVVTHLVTDLETLDAFIGDTLSRFVVALLTLAGTSAILLWMHWPLAVLILLLNPLVILATIRLGKRVKHLKRLENDSMAAFTQALTETLDAIQEIRAANRQNYFLGLLGDRARAVRDRAMTSHWKTDAANRASGMLFQSGIDAFRAAAMLTVLFSDLSIGQMLAVFSYLWFMIAPVEQLLTLQYAFYSASGALGRINQLLSRADEPQYVAQQNPFAEPGGVSIDIEDLHFAYQDEQVLNGLNLQVRAGERVAVVGTSGGGKSTLVQLLLGLYQAQHGCIRFGGVPIEEIGLDVLRDHVAVVLQHPALFNASVRDNLTLGRDCSDPAIWAALETAQLAGVVRQLPAGLETVVGRAGVRLSGGQRQRLAIARMMLGDPAVVILDEATSALDAATEHGLHQAMQAFLQGRTTLIIAHRLSAVKQAERVVVFDEGRIVEQGEHGDLLAEGGIYSRLYGQLQH